MNDDNFTTISSKQRVKVVNDLLQKEGNDLRKVADTLKIKYSTFTKLMQENDYVYIKRLGQYCKFVQDDSLIVEDPTSDSDEVAYIKENFAILQSLIESRKGNYDFTLDKRIYHSSSKTVTKNFRISDDIYKLFAKTCDEEFPHLKLQDIIAQLLLTFTDQYANQNNI
ncbi:hypothetical protein GWK91_16250 [Virgibacillus sp. MSP4-1]|uniref:hypothetical protein n=1 Tax=Virgibacillus sp. MSP4-1 TaxID=2700081 RepID=UPI0005C486A0|nr:hypothetical protein [Virgibacillus sp. MSP4-1]QHS24334.1 hypothetical protein GWK91_16250 [Virgibacillus sp. MSP4-1]